MEPTQDDLVGQDDNTFKIEESRTIDDFPAETKYKVEIQQQKSE